MKFKAFAIFDSAVGAYMQPMFFQSLGQAIRAWLDAVNDPKTQFHAHPSDFTLFELGEYDEIDGTFQNLPTKFNRGTALELMSRAKVRSEEPPQPMLPINGLTHISETEPVRRARAATEKHSERML